MAERLDPVIQGRKLRSELRRARQTANLTQKDVADKLDWSVSKLIRIERGSVGISVTDLRALLQEYEVTDGARVAELIEMAKASRRPSWWTKYKQLFSPAFVTLLGYEVSATVLRIYHGGAIPGLFQTEDYARSVIAAYTLNASAIEDAVTARLERQELLNRENPPDIRVILDEAVIRRWIGGPTVMRGQLEWLRELAARPNITVQVIPFTEGAHAGMRTPFSVYEFAPSDDEDYVVWLEGGSASTLVRNESGDATVYLDRFTELEKQAASAEQSVSLIDDAISQLAASGKVARQHADG